MSHRHLARSIVMQILYQWDFRGCPTAALPAIIATCVEEFGEGLSDNTAYISDTVHTLIEALPQIDAEIIKYADNWPMEQMNLVDRNILRIGTFEMKFSDTIPSKVAINEAIELAKNYGGPSSGKFVNGVLGAMYADLKETDTDKPKTEEKITKDTSDDSPTTEA
ncbi:MAG: transcription antitermination factor NusB [Candidatus Magasanikbacteria bacterium]|nr:transcription antitermination factor NusB [Candidatus Magasanikbacteria bacterium]